MDLRDATITALTKATTEREALDLLIEQQPMSVYEARRALGEAVVSLGWALLVAPELYLCLCAWWRIQRITDDLEVARDTRDRLKGAIDEPETLLIIETSKEDQPLRIGTTEGASSIIRTLKVGPDILSVRSKAFFDGTGTIFKGEDALARAEERFQEAVNRYQRTLEDVTALSPQAMAARLLTRAWREQDVATCRALLEVATKPEDASGDETMKALAVHPAVLAVR